MSDLISREATVSILRARASMALGDVKDAASFFDYCANMIAKIPAVDAKPVKHGSWGDLCRGKVRVCSCCKHHFDNTCNDIDGEWIFCPNCGAKMDADERTQIES